MTTDLDLLIDVVIGHPVDPTPRAMLQDELQAQNQWTWVTVNGYVVRCPESHGLRLLAADWLDWEALRVRDGVNQFAIVKDALEIHARNLERRAEFIRIGIDLFIKPELELYETDTRSLVSKRFASLLSRRDELFVTGTEAGGFIESLSNITASNWLKSGDVITAEHPVQEVTLTTIPVASWHPYKSKPIDGKYHLSAANVAPRVCRTPYRAGEMPREPQEAAKWLVRREWPTVKRWNFPAPARRHPTLDNHSEFNRWGHNRTAAHIDNAQFEEMIGDHPDEDSP